MDVVMCMGGVVMFMAVMGMDRFRWVYGGIAEG